MIYKKGNKRIEISNLKPYKRKCLFVGEGNHIWKVGTFMSDISAEKFEEYLDAFLGLEGKENGDDNTGEF